MLQLFRSSMKSRVGGVIALLFLGLIALAFVAGDVSGSRMFGGVAGGDRVAVAGDRRISTSELSQAAVNALDQLKQENPRLTMKDFVAAGGLTNTVDQLVDRAAMTEFGARHGIIVTDRLIDSEIAKIGAFKGADGKFSQAAYTALLRQRGISEAALRQDIGDGLVARQVLVPAGFGVRLPLGAVTRYAALLTERRAGAIALLPATSFAPSAAPAAAELTAYYTANRTRYIRPERREIRYAVFGEDAVKAVPAPTEAEIAAAYAARKASYAPSERRRLTQLVLPSEAAARAVLGELAGGKSLEAAAAARGLATATLPPLGRDALQAQANPAVAAAAFTAARGQVAGPVRGPLGWTLLRLDAAETTPGKTLEQARGEIAAALTEAKRRAALSDLAARLEEEFDRGGSLGDAAKELALELKATPPLLADGKVYGNPAATVPPELARVVPAAFAMEREGQPQVAEIVAGKQFVVFDVARIAPAAAAPLGEIREQVLADLRLERGAAAARAAAEKVQAAVKNGADLQSAVAALKVAAPPVQQIDLSREQLAGQAQIPPPLALLFAMAQGTTKVLAAPRNGGWYVVSLKQITPGTIKPGDPVVAQAASELSALAAREYADQLRTAIRADVGVTRNQPAIDAVGRQLTGAN